jgi:hypothetical protein
MTSTTALRYRHAVCAVFKSRPELREQLSRLPSLLSARPRGEPWRHRHPSLGLAVKHKQRIQQAFAKYGSTSKQEQCALPTALHTQMLLAAQPLPTLCPAPLKGLGQIQEQAPSTKNTLCASHVTVGRGRGQERERENVNREWLG